MNARLLSPELLDTAPDDAALANLRDLTRINRWLGGHRIASALLESLRPPARFTLLDVGAASGDYARAFLHRFPGAAVVSLDMRYRNLAAAPDPRLVADAFRLPFAERSFDYVFCSLFLHHFTDRELIRVMNALATVARRGFLAIDLERSVLSRGFLSATRPFFGWSPITLHDGPVSVRAGFRKQELENLACRAGLRDYRVRRHPPWFRVSLVAAR
jgi:SAM-dependent methyltransferase